MNDRDSYKSIDSYCPDMISFLMVPVSPSIKKISLVLLCLLSAVLLYLVSHILYQNVMMVSKQTISIREKPYSDQVNEDYYKVEFPFNKEDVVEITVRFAESSRIEQLHAVNINFIIYDPSDWGIPATINTTVTKERIDSDGVFKIDKSILLASPTPLIVWRNDSCVDYITLPAATAEIVLKRKLTFTSFLQSIKKKNF